MILAYTWLTWTLQTISGRGFSGFDGYYIIQ